MHDNFEPQSGAEFFEIRAWTLMIRAVGGRGVIAALVALAMIVVAVGLGAAGMRAAGLSAAQHDGSDGACAQVGGRGREAQFPEGHVFAMRRPVPQFVESVELGAAALAQLRHQRAHLLVHGVAVGAMVSRRVPK